jgi:hypothetical protein
MPYGYWNQLPPANHYNLKQHNPTIHKTKQQETTLKIVAAITTICLITYTTTLLIRKNYNSR